MPYREERNPLLSSSGSAVNAHYGSTTLVTSSRTLDSSSRQYIILSRREKVQLYCVKCIILFSVILERLSFYALSANLYLFLNGEQMNWASYNAMNALFILNGVTYVSSLFGGWIADSCLGRFWTIVVSFFIYTSAYVVFPFIADYSEFKSICSYTTLSRPSNTSDVNQLMDYNDRAPFKEVCSWQVYLSLIFVGLGAGSVRANVAPFGADQVKIAGPDSLRGFFNWFYWCVNIGAFLGIGGVVYLQQSEGFMLGYAIPAGCLGLALLVFILGKPAYKCQPVSGSVITKILLILKEAIKSCDLRRKRQRKNQDDISAEHPVENRPSWLDRAKVRYGGKFCETDVDDVKTIGTILKVFMALIPYWMLYFQMQTTFLDQGLHMKLSFTVPANNCNSTHSDENTFSIPAAWLTLFDVIFLIIFIPLMDQVIYPYLDRNGCQIQMLSRMKFGLFFAAVSMFIAGGVETYRLKVYKDNFPNDICQVIGNTTYHAADISVFWQIPQYALIGLSEGFASVAGMEFACSQAPRSMQGLIMGLFCFCTGVGSFLGTALMIGTKKFWISLKTSGSEVGNINSGRLNCYFFLLGGIEVISLIIFMYIAKRVNVKKPTNTHKHGPVASANIGQTSGRHASDAQ